MSDRCLALEITASRFLSEQYRASFLTATFLVIWCGVYSSASAADFIGKVVGVLDGDTIEILHNGRAERVRLNGIDCPEKEQAFGKVAKQYTSTLVFGKDVTATPLGLDRYGRTIGEVTFSDGRSLNRELVRAGLAWWYRKYAPGDAVLQRLEAEAREVKRGLWADSSPIPPWEWRNAKRNRQ